LIESFSERNVPGSVFGFALSDLICLIKFGTDWKKKNKTKEEKKKKREGSKATEGERSQVTRKP